MELVVSGRLKKEVGGELGISEITVQAHRGRVMQKMRADSLAGLVNMAAEDQGRQGLAGQAVDRCCQEGLQFSAGIEARLIDWRPRPGPRYGIPQ